MVKQVDDFDEFKALIGGDKYVIIDFTASWCPPCKKIGPYFVGLEDGTQNVIMIKVDVDVNGKASEQAGISCMPTFQVWKGGEKVEEFSGASEEKLKALVDKYEAM